MISVPAQMLAKHCKYKLAAVIAQTGKQYYLLIQIWKGYTHRLFNVSNDNGLSDVLSGRIKVEML
jgi:tyrosine-protein kinase Etk/Wzc